MQVGWSVVVGAGLSATLLGVVACLDGPAVADSNKGAMQAKVLQRIQLSAPVVCDRLAWGADSRRVAVGSLLDKHVGIYDIATGQRLPGPVDQPVGVQALTYSPDGRYLAVARGQVDRKAPPFVVSLWDASTAAHIQDLIESNRAEVRDFTVRSMAFSPDSRHLAVSYLDGVFFYDVQVPGKARRVGRTQSAEFVAFSPDSAQSALATAKGIQIVEVSGHRVVTTVLQHSRVLVFTPDGRFLVSAAGPEIQIFDTPRWETAATLHTGDDFNIKSLSTSPNGRYLAAATGKVAKVWELASRSPIANLADHKEVVLAALFSPNGKMLAACGGEFLTIWEVQ